MTWVPFRAVSRRVVPSLIGRGLRIAQKSAGAIAILAVLSSSPPVNAKQNHPPMIVMNDAGGNLKDRVAQISQLQKRGQKVEIRGGYCLSACTLYLGMADTCVSPNVKFGFHGPSSQTYGISLPPREFEQWSQKMASYYPEPLRRWFLRSGRNITVGYYAISGEKVIKMGVSKCT